MGHAFGIFMAHVGTLHSLRSFRRRLPLALGLLLFHSASQHTMKTLTALAIASVALSANAVPLELNFDVRLDRVYSYDGAPFSGLSVGDVRSMSISFDSSVIANWSEVNPWGSGTARLHSFLAGPVQVVSPYEAFVPTSPFAVPIPTDYSAEGITANERGSGPLANIWYEDLWVTRQFSQYQTPSPDGSSSYHYKFNMHWNRTNYDYAPGALYYFTAQEVTNLLDRALNEGTTFSVSQDAYIQFVSGAATGFDLDGTATLRGYRVLAIPEPSSVILTIFGLPILILVRARAITKEAPFHDTTATPKFKFVA
ncbi:hypothetical protein [Pseudaquabacterium rugosum]|uniref:PEP-CTERM sorting domain-containing protein n=1 Tax=Pseudaquabacterium rugosum TaxID=2984194 RepID=A0ABU9B5G5_9BURK